MFLRALFVTIFRVLTAPLWLLSRILSRPRGRFVHLRLGPSVVEVAGPVPWWTRFASGMRKPPTSLVRVRELVDALVRDERREGLLVEIGSLDVGWATAEAIREALAPLAAAGKKTIAYLPRGGGAKELFVALACEQIVTSPPASFLLPGLEGGGLYAGPLLEKLGVRFERFARSEFKTAYESFERASMSEGQRIQVGAVLDGVGAALDEAFAKRGVSRADVERIGLVDADVAKEAGLVDALAYEDQLPDLLGLDRKKEKLVPAGGYLAYARRRFLPRFRRRPYVATVLLRGVIGDSGPASGVGGAIAALRIAARDPRAKAIVLHVDSPGGSAFGSDLLHREVICARQHKPVVASFGNVSASGGYYVSAPADAIVARPLTVTGSIGVIAARPSVDGLVSRLGLVREVVGHAPHGSLLDPTRPLDEASRQAFERSLDASYARFVGIVAEGRKRDVAEVEPLARGRVYLGGAAKELGLVDGLGGFPEAIARAEAAARAKTPGLGELALRVVEVPRGAEPAPLDPPIAALASVTSLIRALFEGGARPVWLAPELLDFTSPTDLALSSGQAAGLSSLHGALRTMRSLLGSLALSLALTGCGPSLAHVDPGPMPPNGTFHGVWFSPQYGDMHLCQSNENVVGEYEKQERHGTIRGTVDGDVLRFEWRDERTFVPGRPQVTTGHGYFRFKPTTGEGESAQRIPNLVGEWGLGDDEVGGGPWTAVLQERQSPDRCYNSIRRTVQPDGAPSSDEIQFQDEGQAPSSAP